MIADYDRSRLVRRIEGWCIMADDYDHMRMCHWKWLPRWGKWPTSVASRFVLWCLGWRKMKDEP